MANPTLPDLSDLKASYFAPKNVMPCLDVEESYLNASSWSEEFDKLLKSSSTGIEQELQEHEPIKEAQTCESESIILPQSVHVNTPQDYDRTALDTAAASDDTEEVHKLPAQVSTTSHCHPESSISDQDTTLPAIRREEAVSQQDVLDLTQTTCRHRQRRNISEAIRNLANRSRRIALNIFDQLDRRLKSTDKKAQRGKPIITGIDANVSQAGISDERAQELIDMAMEHGSLQQMSMVGVITGLMESGKTTLLHRLFGSPPPDLYSSTGVLETSLRGLLHHVVNMSAEEWERISCNQLLIELVSPLIKAGIEHEDTKAHSLEILSSFDIEPTSLSHEGSSVPVATTKSTACEEVLSHVKSESATEAHFNKDSILKLVHMIDTGGQPELMEVMPSLMHNAELVLVLIDLQYGLDQYPKVSYHENGERYKRELNSRYNNRDIIKKIVSTLHSKRSLGKPFRVVIVATHRDCVKDDVTTRVKDLNKDLHELLFPALKKHIFVKSPGEIAFVLNLKKPDEDDEHSLDVIRSFSKNLKGTPLKTPMCFFVYELDLREFAKEKKRQILTLEECKCVGARLKMSDEMILAALVLFHRQNTFLYYPKVLPNHIFINPQVPFDIINSIVRFCYKVNVEKISQGLPSEIVAQLNDAIVSEELLNRSYIISQHFEKGIYEVKDAIALFCHTFTLAPVRQSISGRQASCEDTDGNDETTYLMMCLVHAIPDSEIKFRVRLCTASLMVEFSNGCVPLGCFCSTVSCLLSSKYGWNVVRQEYIGTPKYLYQNVALLCDQELSIPIFLVDSKEYVEIHINADVSSLPPNTCINIQSTVIEAIKEVFVIMRLKEIDVSPAVLCKGKNHLATFKKQHKEYYLICTKKICGPSKPTDEQRRWVEQVNADSTPTYPDTKRICGPSKPTDEQRRWVEQVNADSTPTYPEILKLHIPHKVGVNYRTFGTILLNDTDGSKVDVIEYNFQRQVEHIIERILRQWLQQAPTPVRWSTLIDALKECPQ